MRALLVRGGRVVDPASGTDAEGLDVLLCDGRISAVGRELSAAGAEVLLARGLVVAPGFLDMHVHLREPGGEAAETIASGGQAAAAGGFTAVACMANTDPVNDHPALTEWILQRAAATSAVRVWPIAAVSRGLAGEVLTDFAALDRAGARGFSDDGKPVVSGRLFRAALAQAGELGRVVIDHCEEPTLSPGWTMNEGSVARRLGLSGMSPAGEEIMVARDAVLARSGGARTHVAHISTRGAIERVREEKSRGTPISCEVTPHHFTLDEEAVARLGANAKMSPPLRAAADVAEVHRALADGTIDCIASDHAPHLAGDKSRPIQDCANGVVGLETAVSLALDRLYHGGVVSLPRLIELMSVNPARILGVPGGSLAPGGPGDLTLLDLEAVLEVDPARFLSRSRNTPFAGCKLRGRAAATVVGGRVVFAAGFAGRQVGGQEMPARPEAP